MAENQQRQTDMEEQLSGGMCDGGGDCNDQLTVKKEWIMVLAPIFSLQAMTDWWTVFS